MDRELIDKIQASLMTEEAQWFEQVRRLAGPAASPRVWHRYLGGDFMASAHVRKPKNTRSREIWATGDTIEDTLNNLASAVAAYLYPP